MIRAAFFVAALLAGCAAPNAKTSSHLPTPECAAFGPAPLDYRGRVIRNPHARTDFRKDNPCPVTGLTSGACPGWVVDHIVALKRGGADHPCNMQWQAEREARAKDRVE